MAETPQDRQIRYIQDAHASEVGIVSVLHDLINEVDNPQIRAVFQEHLAVTESQASRLEQRLLALGAHPADGKGLLSKITGKLGDLMHVSLDKTDKVTQDLIKAYATENLEIGMYESLISYSEAIGDTQTAQLARQIQAEEKEAAEKIFPLIHQVAKLPLLETAVV